ncbi:MAG: hypothetical protein HOK98_11190 [Rhodospirillaceae bacterium]|nr:hypothetical protein [Rhodospirillaceae bacterium]MBT5944756.1 hypothetical protein [Rhodospirillaceae bacterium]MBT6405227.1 hypothetical protein [Rhodospirillaceae bacterium]MBT6536737.1 hypothetical protein [Rhodospirillaceae bacterium]MBT7360370.1 hypothetical protein [Rhodospirillaceae bacterium]
MLRSLLSFIPGIGPLLSAGTGIIDAVAGNRRERDTQGHQTDMAVQQQFAAEFRRLERRTWFDSLIDGFNRLPRPVIVAMIIGYFLAAWRDPAEFQIINTALDAVPERMWIIAGVIVTFYFGARELAKLRDQRRMALSAEAFGEQQRRIDLLRQTQHVATGAYASEMTDSATPLSNRSIAEWNRRRSRS